MSLSKFIPITLFIGLQAAILQCLDQVLAANVMPIVSGGGWLAFQAWAVYFLAGCTVKGGIRSLIGYALGMGASIVLLYTGGQLGAAGLGFWAMPVTLLVLVPFIILLERTPEITSFVPAVFVGAGAFFGIMTYVPGATFQNAFVGELTYCVIGLIFGWATVTFRGWYEPKCATK